MDNIISNEDVGVDLTFISRFENRNEKFIKNILQEKEFQVYESLGDSLKIRFLATRWAAKEAIFKITQDKDYLRYQILNNENGKPYVLNHPEIKISISHDGDIVIAIALLCKRF